MLFFFIAFMVMIGSNMTAVSAVAKDKGFCSEAGTTTSDLARQERCYRANGIDFIGNTCSIDTGKDAETPPAATDGAVAPIYILGDSITAGSEDAIRKAFKGKKIEISKINADPGRAISKDTMGNDPTGLEAAAEDKGAIRASGTVVVALGTNSGVEDLDVQIPRLVKEIRSAKENIPIYWVNVFSDGGVKKTSINKTIAAHSGKEKYSIIDTTIGEKITTGSDHIHPNTPGAKTFADKIADGLGKSSKAGKTGGTDVETVYNVLTGLGLAPTAAAGVVGNNVFESGSADPKLSGPNGEGLNPRATNVGHTGIAQWDNSRWAKLVKFAGGESPYSLKVQSEYIYHELEKDYPNSLKKLQAASSAGDAAKIFNDEIERPGSYDPQRGQAAELIYKKYGGGGAGTNNAPSGGGNPKIDDQKGQDDTCCIDPSAGGAASTGSSTSTGDRKTYMYNSGLPGADGGDAGQFILEQWAIHTLKSIAKLKGVSESDVVTQNHIVALIAFALGEGGDINNQWKFNPLNSGFGGDLYVDGVHAGNGTQSFKSFDAGVSATSRHMTEGYQSRLGDVLLKPRSTPVDFFDALVAPEKTPGNLDWAEAANPKSPHFEANYYPARLNMIKQVKTNYKDIASITIGTPNFKDQPNNSRKPALLQFSDANDVSDGTGSLEVSGVAQCCGDQTLSGNITASEPSTWKQIYKTNPEISARMDKGKLTKIDTLVIHFTVGNSEGEDLLSWMGNNEVGIQFNVGKTGTVYQSFPLDNMRETWHAGNANGEAIGIEITGMDVDDLLSNEKQFKAVAELSTLLCDTYDIPCGQPKGKITGDGIGQAQGMIGHNETPGNDHTDPDSRKGQSVDPADSSKHPYMKKLRTAMGFEPEPSKSNPGKPKTGATAEPTSNGNGGCKEDSTATTGSAEMQKTVTVKEPGKFITLPSRYSCPGRTTQIDSRIAPALTYLLTKYNLCADDGLANGHKSHGAGLGVDVRPKDQGKQNSKDEWKKTAEAAVRDMNWWGDGADEGKTSKGCATYSGYGNCVSGAEGPSGKIPKWVRWIGYNGDVDHGDPWHVFGGSFAHIHIGWDTPNGDGVSPTIIANPVSEVYTFPAPIPEDLASLLSKPNAKGQKE